MKNKILIVFFLFALACTDNADLPKVVTLPITEVTSQYAITGGEVIDDGGSPVFARGVCASEDSQNPPSLEDWGVWFTNDSSGIGTYVSKIGVKWHGAAYTIRDTHYVRAYATNSAGTAYGEVLSFYPGDKPLTDNSIDIQSISPGITTANVNFTFYFQMLSTVREMGICYDTKSDPDITSNIIIISNINEGENSISIDNLLPNTLYYIRSYDKNQAGVYYSSVKQFTTSN